MSPGLIFLLIAMCFWSIITSFVAIYTILRYRFNGDKTTWILVVMIAFIGPTLWVLKGRRLVQSS